MKTITIILFSLILNSCGTAKDATTSLNTDMKSQPLNGHFIVSTLNSHNKADKNLSLNFDAEAKRVSGYSGCNQFSGTYTITTNNSISFGPIVSTKKFCQDNDTEATFLQNLQNTTHYSLEDNKVTLLENKKELITAKADVDKTSQKQEGNLTFRYAASSRGSYTLIEVNKETVTSQFNRAEKENVQSCSKDDWNALKTLSESIDPKSITNLEAPSKAHQYDGAAAANVTITVDGQQYSTPTFDAGNPPKEIAELVTKLNSIAKQNTKTKD